MVYKCNLQRTGVFISETQQALRAFGEHGSFSRLREEVFRENLLRKTSSHTLAGLIRAFYQRFVVPHPPLPPGVLVGKAMRSGLPEAVKKQILFPYYIVSDALVHDIYLYLVLPRLRGQATLTREEVIAYLEAQVASHPELGKWAPYTRLRWARGMLALLRAFNLLERAPGIKLLPLYLHRETFAFFWLWLRQEGFAVQEATALELWDLLQAKERLDDLLGQGQRQGWWYYQRSADFVEFTPRFATVEEWLEDAVGQRQA